MQSIFHPIRSAKGGLADMQTIAAQARGSVRGGHEDTTE